MSNPVYLPINVNSNVFIVLTHWTVKLKYYLCNIKVKQMKYENK